MENTRTDMSTIPFKITANDWGDKKTKLKNKFSQLSDTDLSFVQGQEKELAVRLQSKLGKSEAEVQKLLHEL
jgi:hypothetical protein